MHPSLTHRQNYSLIPSQAVRHKDMLCIFCRHVAASSRHVNASPARLSAALKIGPDASSRARALRAVVDARAGGRVGGARRLLGTLNEGQKTTDTHGGADRVQGDSVATGRRPGRRKRVTTEASVEAGGPEEQSERQHDAAQDEKPTRGRPQTTATAGSGPRAMRAIRRKQTQGVEVIQPPPKKRTRATPSTTHATDSSTDPSSASTDPPEADEEDTPEKKKPEKWRLEKAAQQKKFPTGYLPRKRLSPDALPGIRMLHASDPVAFSTPVLSAQFRVSPEAIRRILKSKWRPSAEEEEDRRLRWDRRGEKIWTTLAELGTRPPKKWRAMGVGRVDRKKGEVPKWKKGALRRKREEDERAGRGKMKPRPVEDSLDAHLVDYKSSRPGMAERIS